MACGAGPQQVLRAETHVAAVLAEMGVHGMGVCFSRAGPIDRERYMATWLHGFMATWLYGYMATWLYSTELAPRSALYQIGCGSAYPTGPAVSL